MMTKRSSHMPTFTMIEMTKSQPRFERSRLNHRSCGATTLQRISAQ